MKKVTYIEKGIPVDDARARICLTFAVRAWEMGAKGYGTLERVESRMRPPEYDGEVLDDEGERLKAVYLFLQGFSQRSGKPAEYILGKLHDWWKNHPALLDPRNAQEKSDLFEAFVRDVDPQSREETNYREIGWWQAVMKLLREEYKGDPRQLFYEMRETGTEALYDQVMRADLSCWEDVSALRERIAKQLILFKGVELKVASMIMIFFQEAVWTDRPDFWERLRSIPFVPFDIHHIRMCWMLGIVLPEETDDMRIRRGNRDRVGRPLSNYFSQLCFELGLDHALVAQAFFNVGAVFHHQWNLRRSNPGRQERVCTNICPFNIICKNVVQPHQELNTKKRKRAENGKKLAQAQRAHRAGSSHVLTQAPLGFTGDLSAHLEGEVARLLKERQLIGTETTDRGEICRDVVPRPASSHKGNLFEDPDAELLELLGELERTFLPTC